MGKEDRIRLGQEFIRIGKQYGITIRPCGEGTELAVYGADCSGCMTLSVYEKALGCRLDVPAYKPARKECACDLSHDIGAYDTCGHLCRYCYANADVRAVRENMRRHDPNSPFLVGSSMPGDQIHEARQRSWADRQMRMFE